MAERIDMNKQLKSRRYKFLRLSNNQLLRLIIGEVRIKNIPEGTTLHEAQYSVMNRGWDILVEHPSFPEQQIDGCMPKQLECIEFEETGERGSRKLYLG